PRHQAVVPHQGRARRGHAVAGDRVRGQGHPRERGGAGRHQVAGAPARDARLPRRAAPAGADGRGPGGGRGGAVPGVGRVRDRRNRARRRRGARRSLVTGEETTMPIVTIQSTREATTPEQKAALIKGATDLETRKTGTL